MLGGLYAVFVKGINTSGVKQRGAPFDPVNLVAFDQEKIRLIRVVLADDPGNQCLLQNLPPVIVTVSIIRPCSLKMTLRALGQTPPLLTGRRPGAFPQTRTNYSCLTPECHPASLKLVTSSAALGSSVSATVINGSQQQ